MAKQLKRKGKTFITEHYISPELTALFNEALTDYVSRKYHSYVPDELGVWADPAGMYIKTTHAKWDADYDLYPWADFQTISEDDVREMLFGCYKMYQKYQVMRIRFNDTVMKDLKAMMEM